MDLSKFITPTTLNNIVPQKLQTEGENFDTTDLIYLDSCDDVIAQPKDRIISPTDYAKIGKDLILSDSEIGALNKRSCPVYLRSNYLNYIGDCVDIIDEDGYVEKGTNNVHGYGICPSLHLDLQAVLSEIKNQPDMFSISSVKTDGFEQYHTIEFGEYPKSYVGRCKNIELEQLFKKGKISETGKTYSDFNIDYDNDYNCYFTPNSKKVYYYKGQKYVRVTSNFDMDEFMSGEDDAEYKGKNFIDDKGYSVDYFKEHGNIGLWVKVKPIVWKIKNWDELPREINPNGTGTAKYIDVRTEEAIMSGIPFDSTTWKDSPVRAYLNGYELSKNITSKSSLQGSSFLKDAFSVEMTKSRISRKKHLPKKNNIKSFSNEQDRTL